MSRVYVVVEGQSEESFVSGPLAAALASHGVYPWPIPMYGRPNYARLQDHLARQLKQDKDAYCSTMIDFYGLGKGFPGTPLPDNLTGIQRVERIEREIKNDICRKLPDLRPDRLIPYLSLHEYEALLFSGCQQLSSAIKQPGLAAHFHLVRGAFPTPEDINDGPETAPSKRIAKIYPGYSKTINGAIAATAIGVATMRRECPHFRRWLEQLEALSSL